MTSRFKDHILTGNHTSRPAATAVPAGTLYSCTTHALVYQSSGTTWSTWATLGATTTSRTVLIYASGAYPTRPTGGICEYVGPTQPTDWIANDTWIKAAL